MKIYKNEPYSIVDDVPVFTKDDPYSENYDEIAETLLQNISLEGGGNPWMEEDLWSEAEKDTVSICKNYLKPGDRILDIGVGLGRLLSYFEEVEKYGIDISIDMAKESRKKGIEACKGNVEELPYKDSVFDMIVCTDVLEHVFDLNKTVSEIKRVLKPDGFLVVRVPNEEDMKGYLAPDYPYEYVHLRMFSESSVILFFSKVFQFETLTSKKTYYDPKRVYSKRIPVRSLKNCAKVFILVACAKIPALRKRLKYEERLLDNSMAFVEIIVAFRNKK